jgi:hypothetical protein
VGGIISHTSAKVVQHRSDLLLCLILNHCIANVKNQQTKKNQKNENFGAKRNSQAWSMKAMNDLQSSHSSISLLLEAVLGAEGE